MPSEASPTGSGDCSLRVPLVCPQISRVCFREWENGWKCGWNVQTRTEWMVVVDGTLGVYNSYMHIAGRRKKFQHDEEDEEEGSGSLFTQKSTSAQRTSKCTTHTHTQTHMPPNFKYGGIHSSIYGFVHPSIRPSIQNSLLLSLWVAGVPLGRTINLQRHLPTTYSGDVKERFRFFRTSDDNVAAVTFFDTVFKT